MRHALNAINDCASDIAAHVVRVVHKLAMFGVALSIAPYKAIFDEDMRNRAPKGTIPNTVGRFT